MYEENAFFNSPPMDAVLGRYLDFTRFLSLMDENALFFVRADKLGDPFEGSYSRMNINIRPELYRDQIPERALQQMGDFIRESRRFTLVNCWHWSTYESAAMWRLYSRESDGVAIRTDFKSLSESFLGEDKIFIGTVDYVDYDTAFIPENNIFSPYLHKRKSFEPEKEVRALTQEIPRRDGISDISQDLYVVGKYQPVDLSVLISEVVVAPFAEEWFLELVTSVAARYGLQAAVAKSSLAEEPVWK